MSSVGQLQPKSKLYGPCSTKSQSNPFVQIPELHLQHGSWSLMGKGKVLDNLQAHAQILPTTKEHKILSRILREFSRTFL